MLFIALGVAALLYFLELCVVIMPIAYAIDYDEWTNEPPKLHLLSSLIGVI